MQILRNDEVGFSFSGFKSFQTDFGQLLAENPELESQARDLARKLHEIETTDEPRFAVLLCEGHSDRHDGAPNEKVKHEVEEEKSRLRLDSAKQWLLDAFFDLFSTDEIRPATFHDARRILVVSEARGAGFLVVNKLASQMTEPDRRNNRRVECTLIEFGVVD